MKTTGISSRRAVTLSLATAVLVETFLFMVGLPVKLRPLFGALDVRGHFILDSTV